MRNEDVIKLIEVQGTLTRATMMSEVHRLDEKIDRVIGHQEKQNGKLEKLERQTRIVRWFERNPVKAVAVAATFVVAVVVALCIVDLRATLYKQGIVIKDGIERSVPGPQDGE